HLSARLSMRSVRSVIVPRYRPHARRVAAQISRTNVGTGLQTCPPLSPHHDPAVCHHSMSLQTTRTKRRRKPPATTIAATALWNSSTATSRRQKTIAGAALRTARPLHRDVKLSFLLRPEELHNVPNLEAVESFELERALE